MGSEEAFRHTGLHFHLRRAFVMGSRFCSWFYRTFRVLGLDFVSAWCSELSWGFMVSSQWRPQWSEDTQVACIDFSVS